MRKHGRALLIPAALLVVSLVGAACSSTTDSGAGGSGALSGKVVVSGSSTVQPISSLVAESFSGQNPGVSISVDGPGTGDGFALFCKGEIDISDASRPIKEEEKSACAAAGITFTELKIGLDGITVMTNPKNNAVSCLSKADLYALVGPESEGFKNWSDANPLDMELGGKGTFPNVPLEITAPGEESGTYDAFIELALKSTADERKQDDTVTRPDYQSSGNDNVIIRAMEDSDSSFGWVGFAYAEENASGVRILQVDGGDGCVAPSRETIADGSYPLSRALYIYVNNAKAKASPAVKAYVDYYLANLKQDVADAGYVDLPDDQIQATRQGWTSAGV
jgi:phosphate transport system substrate-binding protein